MKPNTMKITVIAAVATLTLFACSSGQEKPAAPGQPVVAAVIEQPGEPATGAADDANTETDAPKPKVITVIPPVDPPVDPAPKPMPPGDPRPLPEPEPYPIAPEKQIYDFVEEMPEFPGGTEAYKKFLVDNIHYPAIAREMGIDGKCWLRFVVTEAGKITDVQVVRGITQGKECDMEALRVVKMMPDWNPGRNRGKAVSCYVMMPVVFKLEL